MGTQKSEVMDRFTVNISIFLHVLQTTWCARPVCSICDVPTGLHFMMQAKI